jgi:GNAT superfamily N-acetyltransferase
MTVLPIRPALPDDHDAVVETVRLAYAKYVARIGREPAPMLADYRAAIATGTVHLVGSSHLVGSGNACSGLILLYPALDSLFVETVAVHPLFQGSGLGVRLMDFADAQARAHGMAAVTLYTIAKMVENIPFYQRRGFQITGRRIEDGFDRVYFRKDL